MFFLALITTFQPCRLHIWTKPNVNTLLLTLLGRGRWGGGNVDSKRGGMQKKEVYIGRERNEEEKWQKKGTVGDGRDKERDNIYVPFMRICEKAQMCS